MLGKELGVEIEMGEIEKSVSEGIEEVLEMKEGGDDFGEVISRGAIEVGVGGNVVEALDEDQVEEPALRMSKKEKKRRKQVEEVKVGNEVVDSTSSKRPKKKRKKGDAFDDLFSSLV